MSLTLAQLRQLLSDFATNEEGMTQDLDPLLQESSRTGFNYSRWDHLRVLIRVKLVEIVANYDHGPRDTVPYPRASQHLQEIISKMESFKDAPFSLQRMCELLLQPRLHYGSSRKFLFAFEKLVNVSSTIEPTANVNDSIPFFGESSVTPMDTE